MAELYRNWQVCTGNHKPFAMILMQAVSYDEALAGARERWADAEVSPSGPAEVLPDIEAIAAECKRWLEQLTRQQIMQKLNQVKTSVRELYRDELNKIRVKK